MNVCTDKHSSVIAANQGEAHHPAEFADRPLHWSSVIAGLFNSTPGINAVTPPVPGGSMVSLLIPTGSSTAHNTTSMTSSTSTLEKPHAVSIVTITDRTTVTETSCSASSTPINSLKTPSTLPTSSIDEDVVGGTLPVTPGVSKTTLVPPVNTPAIPAFLWNRRHPTHQDIPIPPPNSENSGRPEPPLRSPTTLLEWNSRSEPHDRELLPRETDHPPGRRLHL
jgi:hypothetical protein